MNVKLTDMFIKKLAEYFSGLDREVLVFMVGDYCPSILQSLPVENGSNTEMIQLKKRQVPYFIWTNYKYNDADGKAQMGYIDIHNKKKTIQFNSQECFALSNYFYMEYNRLTPDRKDKLFDPELK